MHKAEPVQSFVGKLAPRIKRVEQVVSKPWKTKVETGDSPHQNKQKAPEPQCTVQVPTEATKIQSPVHSQCTMPVADSRPPYNCARQTQQRQTNGANAIYETAGASR